MNYENGIKFKKLIPSSSSDDWTYNFESYAHFQIISKKIKVSLIL